jgi:hypothetical protein
MIGQLPESRDKGLPAFGLDSKDWRGVRRAISSFLDVECVK